MDCGASEPYAAPGGIDGTACSARADTPYDLLYFNFFTNASKRLLRVPSNTFSCTQNRNERGCLLQDAGLFLVQLH